MDDVPFIAREWMANMSDTNVSKPTELWKNGYTKRALGMYDHFLIVCLFLHFPSEDLGVIHKSCLLINPEAKWSSGNAIGFVFQRPGSNLGWPLPGSVPSRKSFNLFPSLLSHLQTANNNNNNNNNNKHKSSFPSYRTLGSPSKGILCEV